MAKTAIVTDGSRTRGRAIARRLAEDGFVVVLNSCASTHNAEAAVAEITGSGGRAIAFHTDVSSPDEVKQLFSRTLQQLGRIDVVVNNVGAIALSPVALGEVQLLDEMVRINLRGAFLVLSEAAVHTSEGGRIIAFSNKALGRNLTSYGPYNASIAGIESLVRVLANELRGNHITVNALAPEHGEDEVCVENGEGNPLTGKKIGAPGFQSELNELLHIVSFLAGPDGGWVSGQVIPIGSGQSRVELAPARDSARFSTAA